MPIIFGSPEAAAVLEKDRRREKRLAEIVQDWGSVDRFKDEWWATVEHVEELETELATWENTEEEKEAIRDMLAVAKGKLDELNLIKSNARL